MKRLQSISDINSDDGTHTCSYCHLQLGEGEDNCMNCALFQHEFEKEMLIKLYEEIKPYMLQMEPEVIAYKSTPSLVPHAKRVEKFMAIMRDMT